MSFLADSRYWDAVNQAPLVALTPALMQGDQWWKRRRREDGASPWMVALQRGGQSHTLPEMMAHTERLDLDLSGEDLFGRTLWAWILHYGVGRTQAELYPHPDPSALRGLYWPELVQRRLARMTNSDGEGVLLQVYRPQGDAPDWDLSAHSPYHTALKQVFSRHLDLGRSTALPTLFCWNDWVGGPRGAQEEAGRILFERDLDFFHPEHPSVNQAWAVETLTEWMEPLWGGEEQMPQLPASMTAALQILAMLTYQKNMGHDVSSETVLRHLGTGGCEVVAESLIAGAPSGWWESGALRHWSRGHTSSEQWARTTEAQRNRMVLSKQWQGGERVIETPQRVRF